MATRKRREWHNAQVWRSISLAQPAVRMAYVHAWADDEHSGHRIYPVVALQAAIIDGYRQEKAADDEPRPPRSPTHDSMEQGGWIYDGVLPGCEYDVVLFDPDLGLCNPSDLESFNSSGELVACPWPPEEDSTRLAEVIRRVESRARAAAEKPVVA